MRFGRTRRIMYNMMTKDDLSMDSLRSPLFKKEQKIDYSGILPILETGGKP